MLKENIQKSSIDDELGQRSMTWAHTVRNRLVHIRVILDSMKAEISQNPDNALALYDLILLDVSEVENLADVMMNLEKYTKNKILTEENKYNTEEKVNLSDIIQDSFCITLDHLTSSSKAPDRSRRKKFFPQNLINNVLSLKNHSKELAKGKDNLNDIGKLLNTTITVELNDDNKPFCVKNAALHSFLSAIFDELLINAMRNIPDVTNDRNLYIKVDNTDDNIEITLTHSADLFFSDDESQDGIRIVRTICQKALEGTYQSHYAKDNKQLTSYIKFDLKNDKDIPIVVPPCRDVRRVMPSRHGGIAISSESGIHQIRHV